MASRTVYSTWTPQKPTLFSGHYLHNRSTLDRGVLGYIGIVQHKEHSPEVLSIPPGTSCIFAYIIHYSFFSLWRDGLHWARASSFTRFLDHTQRCNTVGRIPLDEWSARRRDLYLTTHNIHSRETSMPPGGIRTHSLNRRLAADLRLRPRGHWDRVFCLFNSWKCGKYLIKTVFLGCVQYVVWEHILDTVGRL